MSRPYDTDNINIVLFRVMIPGAANRIVAVVCHFCLSPYELNTLWLGERKKRLILLASS